MFTYIHTNAFFTYENVLYKIGNFIPVISSNGIPSNTLQALDIFLVQANTNVLVAHFAPLVCYLFLQTQLPLPFRNKKTIDPIEPATEKPSPSNEQTSDTNPIEQ